MGEYAAAATRAPAWPRFLPFPFLPDLRVESAVQLSLWITWLSVSASKDIIRGKLKKSIPSLVTDFSRAANNTQLILCAQSLKKNHENYSWNKGAFLIKIRVALFMTLTQKKALCHQCPMWASLTFPAGVRKEPGESATLDGHLSLLP